VDGAAFCPSCGAPAAAAAGAQPGVQPPSAEAPAPPDPIPQQTPPYIAETPPAGEPAMIKQRGISRPTLIGILVVAVLAVVIAYFVLRNERGFQRARGAAPAPAESEMAKALREAEPCRNVISEALAQRGTSPGQPAPAVNQLAISGREGISWNEAAIDRVRLRQFLDISSTMRPAPLLVVRVRSGADPAHVQSIREAVYLGLSCRAESF